MAALEKARLYDPDDSSSACQYVQFNPGTLRYTVGDFNGTSKGVEAAQEDGGAQEEQHQGDPTGRTGQAVLSVNLFYHTYAGPTDYSSVKDDVDFIRGFMRRAEDDGQVSSRRIAFAWGSIAHMGTLDSFSVTYQMFAADGTPVQAEVSITITGDDPDTQAQAKDRDASVQLASALESEKQALLETLEWLFG